MTRCFLVINHETLLYGPGLQQNPQSLPKVHLDCKCNYRLPFPSLFIALSSASSLLSRKRRFTCHTHSKDSVLPQTVQSPRFLVSVFVLFIRTILVLIVYLFRVWQVWNIRSPSQFLKVFTIPSKPSFVWIEIKGQYGEQFTYLNDLMTGSGRKSLTLLFTILINNTLYYYCKRHFLRPPKSNLPKRRDPCPIYVPYYTGFRVFNRIYESFPQG